MEKKNVMNGRYADSLITGNTHLYHGLEIHGVRDQNEPDDPMGTCCEVDDENPEFFSVYARYKPNQVNGCIEVLCVGDFSDYVMAKDYACELSRAHRWPIHDYQAHQTALPKYAVSDQNGHYVFYTNDYDEAKSVMCEIDTSLSDEDQEGCAAIMKRTDENTYELYL